MKKIIPILIVFLSCSACTSGGSGGSALTANECDALIRKGWELNSVPFDGPAATKLFNQSVKDCADDHKLYSRKEYDCMMSASATEDYAGCSGAR
jgi:hypothetical protein